MLSGAFGCFCRLSTHGLSVGCFGGVSGTQSLLYVPGNDDFFQYRFARNLNSDDHKRFFFGNVISSLFVDITTSIMTEFVDS